MLFSNYLHRLLLALDRFSLFLSKRNIYQTNVLAVSRALLATGTLFTLFFSPFNAVFINGVGRASSYPNLLNSLNLFLIIKSHTAAQITGCIILLAVISGYFPRITGILHWWVSLSFFNGGYLVDGGDQITCVLTFLLVPLTLFDPRINNWRKSDKQGNPYVNIFVSIPLFLVSLQMSVLYYQSSQAKLAVSEWVNGTAVYYFLNNNLYGPVPFVKHIVLDLLSNKFLALLSTWSVVVLEILLFAAIFMRQKAKKRLFYFALFFHFMVIILHGLVSFFFAMAGGLVLYLYPIGQQIRFFDPAFAFAGKLRFTRFSAMKNLLLSGLICLSLFSSAQNRISHAKILSVIETKIPDNGMTVIYMTTFYKNDKWKFVTKKDRSEDLTFVLGPRVTSLTTVMGKKMGFYLDDSAKTTDSLKKTADSPKKLDTAQVKQDFFISYLDSTRVISGFTCNQALITYTKPGSQITEATVWYCKSLTFGATKKNIGLNINGLGILEGYPIEVNILMSNKIQVHVLVTAIDLGEVEDNEFVIPKDYKITSYEAFLSQVNKLNKAE